MVAMDKKNDRKEEEEATIHEDVLESILSHVPLTDLVSACRVSKSWNRSVFFSLRRVRVIKPWLLIYSQSKRPPYATSALAYDPRSDAWIEIKNASTIEQISAVGRSSHSKLLYTLSPSRFSFSVDPLHLTWQHVDAPRVWRIDPIVAVVGHSVVVAGGVCDFEDDDLAVELLDINTGAWETCESMPELFKGSAASTWLSIAASSDKMYVTEKRSGTAYSFDPKTRSWTELFDLRPVGEGNDGDVYSRVIGLVDNRLIMAGITGDEENPTGIRLWEVSDESPGKFKLIGSMTKSCLDKLKGEDCSSLPLTSITLNAVGDMVYIHNPAEPGEIAAAEMAAGKFCDWRSLPNTVAKRIGSQMAERLIVACSDVRLSDLSSALRKNRSFCVIPDI